MLVRLDRRYYRYLICVIVPFFIDFLSLSFPGHDKFITSILVGYEENRSNPEITFYKRKNGQEETLCTIPLVPLPPQVFLIYKT